MKQFTATWNGTTSQGRALVETWKAEQEEKERKRKMVLWFSKNKSIHEAREKVMNNF